MHGNPGSTYNAMDCVNKIAYYLFDDSKIAKNMACGRTKAELIVKMVLGPFFGNDFLKIGKLKSKSVALQL